MGTAPPADAALAERLRARDPTAWEELYEEYGPRLRAFACGLARNPHDADDLVQETFVRALPRLDKLDPATVQLGPYLYTTLRNLFLKSVERGRRAEPVAEVPEPAEPAPIEDDPERSTLLGRQQQEVRAANARLAPRQRLVLALRELEDRSYAEIGEVVGLNENAVAQLISRARESLRTELRLAQVDPDRLPEACRTYLPLLSRHLDGQLRGPRLEETLAHLEGCETCQDALESMREAQRRYRTLLLPIGGEGELRERIEAELTSAGYWAGAGSQRGVGARAKLTAGAAVALVALGGGGIGAAVLIDGRAERAAATTTAPTSAAQPTTTTAPATTATRPAPESTPPATTTSPPTTAGTSAVALPAAQPPTTPPAPPPPAPAPPATSSPATSAPTPAAPPATPTVEAPAPPRPARTTAVPTTTAPPRDTVAPTVTILSRPPTTTTSPTATIAFRASEAGSTFTCRRNGGAAVRCTSPAAYADLPLGAHTLAVRARDRAGNLGPETVVRWTVVAPPDTTPPTTTIVAARTQGDEATFEFTSSEPGSTFACALGAGAFEACSSPRTYTGLVPGVHQFAVRATDAAGNTGAPATHAWTVAPPPLPDLVVTALSRSGFTIANVGSAPAGAFVVTVSWLSSPLTFAGLAPGQSATRSLATCLRTPLTVVVDSSGRVQESDEGNNSRTITVRC